MRLYQFISFVTAALLLSSGAFAATAQVNSVVQYNGGQNDGTPGITIPNPTAVPGQIMLIGFGSSTTHNNLMQFFKQGSTSQYQVPNAKTFVADVMCFWSTAVTPERYSLGTCSTTFSNNNTCGGTQVPFGGSNSNHFLPGITTSYAVSCYKIPLQFGQNLYPYWSVSTDADTEGFWMIGQEL